MRITFSFTCITCSPVDLRVTRARASNVSIRSCHAQWLPSVFCSHQEHEERASLKDFVKKSDHRVGGLPNPRLTSSGVQSVTARVHRLSSNRITCPAHLILLSLAYAAASLIFDLWRRVELLNPVFTCVKRETPSITLSMARSMTLTACSSCLRVVHVSEAYVRA